MSTACLSGRAQAEIKMVDNMNSQNFMLVKKRIPLAHVFRSERDGIVLSTSLGYVTECFFALIGNILPIAGLNLIAWEEL